MSGWKGPESSFSAAVTMSASRWLSVDARACDRNDLSFENAGPGSSDREADILVAAIGRKAMLRGDFIKPGAVVIDVGANRTTDRSEVVELFGPDSPRLEKFDKDGHIWVGDVHEREVMEVASKLSPVPGGVGPMTITMLMKNTIKAARIRRERGANA